MYTRMIGWTTAVGELSLSWILLAHNPCRILYCVWKLAQEGSAAILPSFSQQNPRCRSSGVMCFSSQKTSRTRTFSSLFSTLAQSIALLHTWECMARFVVWCSTHIIRITGTSELHTSFKHRYIRHWLTYFNKTLDCSSMPLDVTSRSIKINELFTSYVENVRCQSATKCLHSTSLVRVERVFLGGCCFEKGCCGPQCCTLGGGWEEASWRKNGNGSTVCFNNTKWLCSQCTCMGIFCAVVNSTYPHPSLSSTLGLSLSLSLSLSFYIRCQGKMAMSSSTPRF